MAPASWRAWIRAHPIWTAFAMGLALALIGWPRPAASTAPATAQPPTCCRAKPSTRCQPASAGQAGRHRGVVLGRHSGRHLHPALTTGAGIGHHIWELAGEGVDQRVLVLVSMAAFLAAATQAPLTASVVVMEMTGSQPMLFWLLVGSLLASGVSRQFCPQPFYHLAAGRFRRRHRRGGRAARTGTSAVR